MSEGRAVVEYRELRRSPLWPDRGAPDGTGRGVLLIGGFAVPPRTLRPLGRWLAGSGWHVQTADLGWNTACGTRAVDAVTTTLREMARRHGRVAIVGHSRGGVLGRVAAVRSPGVVDRLVTVCTPWALGPPDRPGVGAATAAVQFARRRGIDVLGSVDCAEGPCCTDFRRQLHHELARPWTLIRSDADAIAGDLARAEAADSEVVIGTSHLGSVLSVAGWDAIGAALT